MTETQSSLETGPERTGALVRPASPRPSCPSWSSIHGRSTTSSLAPATECGELDDLLAEDRRWLRRVARRLARAGRTRIRFPASASSPRSAASSSAGRRSRPPATSWRQSTRSATRSCSRSGGRASRETPSWAPSPAEPSTAIRRPSRTSGATSSRYKGHPVLPGSHHRTWCPAARRIVHVWLPRFETIEARVVRMIERDVAARRRGGHRRRSPRLHRADDQRGTPRARAADPPHRPGAHLLRPPVQLALQGRRRPADLLPHRRLGAGRGPAHCRRNPTVRLYRALGDETRLRILKLLADRDRYLTETGHGAGVEQAHDQPPPRRSSEPRAWSPSRTRAT